MKKIFPLLAVIIFLSSFTIEDPFAALLKKLEEFTKRYPTEKVHLHLDKPYYAAGDDIWFKAYVADARTSMPATESAILYVELVNELDSISKQIRLPMQNGITWGDFKLPDTLIEGNYRIRAYTQLMRNAGPDFFFDKTVRIGSKWANKASTKTTFANGVGAIVFTDSLGKPLVNRLVSYAIQHSGKEIKGSARTNETGQLNITIPSGIRKGTIIATINLGKGIKSLKTIPIKLPSTKIDVQFLPEGGTLVQELTSRIGIKAIDANGKGIDVSGVIVDDKGEEATTFQTSYLGMGSFYFSPAAGKNYTAKVKQPDGTGFTVALPKAELSGYLINATQLDTMINVKVTLSTDLMNNGELNLIGHRNGMVYLNAKLPTTKQVARITLPKSRFPSGIVQLTLFSPQDMPVAERVVFVNNASNRIELNLQKLKESYAKREHVELEFGAQGSYSVAVTNSDVIASDQDNESNIFTSLLLTADLKGHIEKPNTYFINDETPTKERLDNLLLTQGWRKVDWRGISSSTLPAMKYQIEKGIIIRGTITKDKKPLANSKISLMTNNGGMFVIDTLSDKNGRFAFEGLEFVDSVKFIIQARSEAGKKTVDIELDLIDGQKVTTRNNSGEIEVNVNNSMQSYLKESTVYFEEQNKQGLRSKTIQLNEVKIKGEKLNPARNSKNLLGPGVADQVFDGDDMMNSPTLSSYLFSKMSGLTIKNGRPVFIGGRGIGGLKVLVDGNEMFGFQLNDIPVELVESVEIIISPAKSAIYRGSVMLITTRQGPPKWAIVKYAPGVITYTPKGYYNARQFYSPKYDVEVSSKPDFRTTVFWDPNLGTDDTGKAKIEYFNTDQPGNYRIVIEGMDATGRIARKTYTYRVN